MNIYNERKKGPGKMTSSEREKNVAAIDEICTYIHETVCIERQLHIQSQIVCSGSRTNKKNPFVPQRLTDSSRFCAHVLAVAAVFCSQLQIETKKKCSDIW